MNEILCSKCNEYGPKVLAKGWKICVVCYRKYQKEQREKRSKTEVAKYQKEYRTKNSDQIKAQRAGYRLANKEKLKKTRRENWARHGKKYSASHYEWKKKKLQTDLQFRLRETIRARISMAIRGKAKKGSAIDLLGCTMDEFKAHIERQFQPGMTWENWSLTGWHLDHIKPIKDFDLTDPKQLAEVCHYTNMRPLWASENLARRFE